jgi:hypothetical protein
MQGVLEEVPEQGELKGSSEQACKQCSKVWELLTLPPRGSIARKRNFDVSKYWRQCATCATDQLCYDCVVSCEECGKTICTKCFGDHMYTEKPVEGQCVFCKVSKALPMWSPLKCGFDVEDEEQQDFWKECKVCKEKMCEDCCDGDLPNHNKYCNSCFPSKLSRSELEAVTIKVLKTRKHILRLASSRNVAFKRFKKAIAEVESILHTATSELDHAPKAF